MPRSRYEEAQLALAKLLIQLYYVQNPQKFVFVIKYAVLQEARCAFIPGDASTLHTVLRNSTLAAQLFKFGALCYDRDAFLSFFKDETTNGEFSFFEGDKGKLAFDQLTQRAHSFYVTPPQLEAVSDFITDFKANLTALFTNVIGHDVFEGKTEVSREPYTAEEWKQILQDFDNIFEAIAPRKCAAINAGEPIVIVRNGEKYSFWETGVDQAQLSTEKTHLLDDDDNPRNCCRCM